MKSLPKLVILAALFALASCGKNNESGKSNTNGVCIQFGANGQCAQYSQFNAGFSGPTNLGDVINQIPCIFGGGRTQIPAFQAQLNPNVISTAGQSYLGITAMGDIAIAVGTGTPSVQMNIFMCQGSQMSNQMGPILLGEYSSPTCPIKTVTAANFGSMSFRTPAGGIGVPPQIQPLGFCR